MDEVKYRIVGIGPCMMKSGQSANPLNPYTRKLAAYTSRGKGNKLSEEETFEKYRIEWEGSLYLNPETGAIGWPSDNVLACLRAGARRTKLGKKVERGVLEAKPFFDLIYDGPKDLDALWADGRFTDIRNVNGNPSAGKKSTIQRCRPIFRNWQMDLVFNVDTLEIGVDQLEACLVDAGAYVGLSDYRPRYGRFVVKGL